MSTRKTKTEPAVAGAVTDPTAVAAAVVGAADQPPPFAGGEADGPTGTQLQGESVSGIAEALTSLSTYVLPDSPDTTVMAAQIAGLLTRLSGAEAEISALQGAVASLSAALESARLGNGSQPPVSLAPGASAAGGQPQPCGDAPETRQATTTSNIEHDGQPYAPGAPVALTRTQFKALSKAGGLVEEDWDDCR